MRNQVKLKSLLKRTGFWKDNALVTQTAFGINPAIEFTV